ncbi:MAG: KH domain-containing protein, partial [Pseudomonadota bacterium]
MGHKVNPIGMRLQVNRTWDSRWYADTKDYGYLLLEDIKIREFIEGEAKQAGVSKVIIERPHRKCRVTVHTARPGVIIGKKGADIETLRSVFVALPIWPTLGERSREAQGRPRPFVQGIPPQTRQTAPR